MEARRPVPPLSAALASMRDTCEVFGVPPLLDPDLAAAFAYFAEHGDAIRASGVGEVRAAMPAPGTRPPWTAWRNAIEPMMGGSWSEQNPPDLAHTAELRLGMALWRLTRLEFTEMIPEDFRFAILWLTRPGSAAKTDALGALKLFVDALNKAAATVPKHLIRSRCEVATTLWAPKPEPPESVGDLPWGKYAENGTPNPVPRPGRFTLFARLPKEGPAASASARTSARGGRSGTLDETASVEEAARALVAAGLAASFSVADWGEERGAAVLRGGAAGSGAALATLSVDHLNGPSPACSGPPRFGSLIIVNWLVEDGPTDQKKVTPKAVARALKKRFVPKARPATASTTGARAGPGTSTTTAASAPAATPAAAAAGVAAAAAASGSGDASDSSATAVTKVVRQTAWGACSIEHRVVRVSVDGHPDLILEATSGTGGGAPGEDRQMASQAVSTIWKLLRGEEEVARCLMPYCNMQASSYGPTIELFGVRRSLRKQGFGRLFHQSICASLKGPSGWFPRDAVFGLQICECVSGHGFFEKMGFLWTADAEEVGLMNMLRGPMAASEDAVLAIHRVPACASCGARAGPEGQKLVVCGRCRCRLFCGTACQKVDWREHKVDCKRRKLAAGIFTK